LSLTYFQTRVKAKENPTIEFSFNLSSLDIEDHEIQKNILKRLNEENLNERITLEILESEEFQDYNNLLAFEKRATAQNIKLSIDDFGSGYSNFSHLIDIDFNYIKIDGSLIQHILKNQKYEMIIKEIINFAHALNAKTIAEFVENEEIAIKLKEIGVDMLQGYYIGKPKQQIL